MSIMSTVTVAVSVYTWGLCLISTVSPYWTYQNQGNQIIRTGLWRNCTVHGVTSDCKKPSEGWIHAVQALMIIGVLVLFLSMVCGCLKLKDESSSKVAIVATLSALLGGCLVAAAVIVFEEKDKHNSSKFSAGFCLPIITAVTAYIAAALFAVSRRDTGYTPLAP
ncbi:epithelial membrane protein 3-like [Mercenaria mercenaria]|uniref:epithelial membrane protein 3-like n=1 Tax=Mercenaria mercenaria TaxID=6596 RepID=UPI00234E90B8|nr:epithelial membrane protein 3-like [Mercenaria mercenaria]